MAWEALKSNLLEDVGQRIAQRSDAGDRTSLVNLGRVFFERFPPEDLRGRSSENLYGCLYGLLRFMHSRGGEGAKVRILNPDMESHGWESKYTVIAVLCRDMPFCTASVRGEINRRNIAIHTLASCNLATRRDEKGMLQEVLPDNDRGEEGVSHESLLYFEIARHSDPADLEDLRLTLVDILGEVAIVVGTLTPCGAISTWRSRWCAAATR